MVCHKVSLPRNYKLFTKKMRFISTWTNIQNISRKKGSPSKLNDEIKEKLDIFLSDNTNSFTLPGSNNQIYISKNEHGESIFSPKK